MYVIQKISNFFSVYAHYLNINVILSFLNQQEEYELWFAELRSKSTGLFRSIAHSEPEISASYLCRKLEYLLDTHGNGEPRDHLDSSNNLTMISDAVIQFDGVTVPLEHILQGMPSWSLEIRNDYEKRKLQVRHVFLIFDIRSMHLKFLLCLRL